MAASKKGVSAHQIGRMLGVTYKTAWFLCHRIREALNVDCGPLGGPDKGVEVDETYVGGKARACSGQVEPPASETHAEKQIDRAAVLMQSERDSF